MRNDRLQLLLASFLMLFVELVLIRWAGAYIVYLSYFSNFVLLGSFLGIGLGFLRAHRGPDLFKWAPFALAVFLGLVKAFPVQIDRTGGDLIYFGSLETKGLPTWVMLPFVFLAVAAIMMMIAHGVAQRFQKFTGARGVSARHHRLAVGDRRVLVARVLPRAARRLDARDRDLDHRAHLETARARHRRARSRSCWSRSWVSAAGLTIWSQYYRVQYFADDRQISVNGIPHQAMDDIAGTIYEVPYQRLATPPKNVLIVGAGNGNDVAAALAAGAEHVDAVEIDPELQDLGADVSPRLSPYDDPRVTRITNDGRAYLQQTDTMYDLIIFALPDSLTLVSGQSAVRLESFLFTKEAMQAAQRPSEPRRRVLDVQLLPRAVAAGSAGRRPRTRSTATHRASTAAPRARRRSAPSRCSRSGSSRRTRLCVRPGRQAARSIAPATDDRPFVYLQDAVDPVALSVDAGADPDRVGARRATGRRAGSARCAATSTCSSWAPGSCCSRPSPWCSSRCCSARRGS